MESNFRLSTCKVQWRAVQRDNRTHEVSRIQPLECDSGKPGDSDDDVDDDGVDDNERQERKLEEDGFSRETE